jgi:hypothetical protein
VRADLALSFLGGGKRLSGAFPTSQCGGFLPNFESVNSSTIMSHWQAADGELVTTYKTYHGTHQGTFLGLAPTGRRIHFESVDVMRVRNDKITEHRGVANLFSLMQQLGAWPTATQA